HARIPPRGRAVRARRAAPGPRAPDHRHHVHQADVVGAGHRQARPRPGHRRRHPRRRHRDDPRRHPDRPHAPGDPRHRGAGRARPHLPARAGPVRGGGPMINRGDPDFWSDMFDVVSAATWETLYMVFFALLFTVVVGVAIGVLLVTTEAGGLYAKPFGSRALGRVVNRVLDVVVNIGRSIPFIILMFLLIPFTRF